MRLMSLLPALFAVMALAISASAQAVDPPAGATGAGPPAAASVDRPEGSDEALAPPGSGLESLEDILARQRGEDVEREPRDFDSAAANASGIGTQLGVLGGASDSEVWEALRFGTADVSVSAGGDPARVLVQDRGMWWLQVREGPLREYGGWLLLGTIGLLALFFLVRGRIRIDHGWSGRSILRFSFVERLTHWTLATSFILLALTGLLLLFGRGGLIPLIGLEAYSALATGSKWVHNNVSWAFMLALVLAFVFWIAHNLPSRTDLKWIARGGGMFGGEHPPAKKFNFGQKLIFWSVIVFGASVSVSGLSLLFPFELPMFAKTFGLLNDMGLPALLGREPFPAELTPHAEMQYAQLWHAIIGFVMMAIIIAHIYLGTIGMEGAFSAMGSGRVDENWAREHHSLWAERKLAEGEARRRPDARPTPAE